MTNNLAAPAHRPPDECVHRSSGRTVTLTVIATLAVLLAVNLLALWFLRSSTTNVGYLLVEKKWQLLLSLDQPVDWLIVGDSSCNQGVDPHVLGQRLGGRAVNLCTMADVLAVNDAWMLETYLARFGAPRNVIVMHAYDVWGRPANRDLLSRVPLEWGFWERLEPRLEMTAVESLRAGVQRYVPLYSQNTSLAAWLQTPWIARRIVENARLTDLGYMQQDRAAPRTVRDDAASHLRNARTMPTAMSAENRAALEQLVKRSKEHGFQMYFANGPIFAGLYAEADFRASFTSAMSEIKAVVKDASSCAFVLQTPATFPAEQMQNADHATHAAAEQLTIRLAEEILAIERSRPAAGAVR